MSIVCLRCGTANVDDATWCGGCNAYLPHQVEPAESSPQPEPPPPSSLPVTPSRTPDPEPASPRQDARAGVIASLAAGALQVEPGKAVTCEVRVQNTGTRVDTYDVRPLGPAAPWTSCTPAEVPLFPGAEALVRLTFAPPRAAEPAAGPTAFAVSLQSQADPGVSASVSGSVEVGPFLELTAELQPRTSRARFSGQHKVSLMNRGNTAARAELAASDPEEDLRFEFKPPVLHADRGSVGAAQVRVRPRRWIWWKGPEKTHAFELTLRPGGAEPLKTEGRFTQRPVIGRWTGRLAAAAAVVLLVGAIALQFQGPIQRSAAMLSDRLIGSRTAQASPGPNGGEGAAQSGAPSPAGGDPTPGDGTPGGANPGGGGPTAGGGPAGPASLVPRATCASNVASTAAPTGHQAIPGLALTVDNGGAARSALVSLSANAGVAAGAEVRVAYSVDGGPPRENVYGPANLANHQEYWEARAVTAVIPLAAGTHTITPHWRVSGAAGKNATMDVRCLTVKSALAGAPAADPIVPAAVCASNLASTSAPAGHQAIPGLAVTVNNGSAARRALVSVSGNAGVDAGAEIRIAYSVDGGPAQENVYGPANLANHQEYWEARAVTALIPLAAGTHTIAAHWRISGSAGKGGVVDRRCLTVESGLASVPATAPVVPAAVCAANSVGTTAPTGHQAIPGLAVTVNNGSSARTALVELSGNAGVDTGAEIRVAYSVDGGPPRENVYGPANLANHQEYWEARTVTAVIPLAAGTHTITAHWRISGAAGKGGVMDRRCLAVDSAA